MWLDTKRECPVDRAALEKSQLNPSLVIRALVHRLTTACTLCSVSSGAVWTGTMELWPKHMLEVHSQLV